MKGKGKIVASSHSPRYRQTVSMVIESTIPTDAAEMKKAVAQTLSMTVLSCMVGEAELR